MEKEKKNNISFEELSAMIKQYADGSKKQDRPQIVWIDDNIAEIVKYRDVIGFASSLGKSDEKIAFYDKAGSPLTDHEHRLDNDGNLVKISEKERMSFTIPSPAIKYDDKGNLITRLFIHSPFICYIGEKGLTSLEYGVLVHENLNIPTILMYPLNFRERILAKGSISGYDELFCSESAEEYVKKWLASAEKSVYDFYLDFLKASPWEHIDSFKFDPRYKSIKGFYATFCSPLRWEDASGKVEYELRVLINTLFATSEESVLNKVRNLLPVLSGNRILFDNLEKILALAPEDTWQDWLSTQGYDTFKVNPTLSKESPRIDILKSYLCSFSLLGNIPEETRHALLKYHKLM